MEIIRITRDDPDFYLHVGPIFGSRRIEKETHDRFYDLPGKIWYIIPDLGAASRIDGTIKNFWAVNDQAAEALLLAIMAEEESISGVVPRTFEHVFRQLGFSMADHQKNFLEVQYEKD